MHRMSSLLALLSDLRSWGLHITVNSGLEKTGYLKWSLNSQSFVGCAIQNWVTMYHRKLKCTNQQKKEKMQLCSVRLLFVCFVFLIIFESGTMKFVDQPENSYNARHLHASCQPGVCGFTGLIVETEQTFLYTRVTDPSGLTKWYKWQRKGRASRLHEKSAPCGLRLGICKLATSQQPTRDQLKAVNLRIPQTFICCQLPETQHNHKGLDNLFTYVSTFLVSFPFFQSGEMLRNTPSCVIG